MHSASLPMLVAWHPGLCHSKRLADLAGMELAGQDGGCQSAEQHTSGRLNLHGKGTMNG